jgi:hypothetical protein
MSKYTKMITGLDVGNNTANVYIDVYDVLKAFDVRCPALQHLIKKALNVGVRGHKDHTTDLQDIMDSSIRAIELYKGNKK